MAHGVQHAFGLLAVLDLHGVADPSQPERAQRVELFLVRAVARAQLGDVQRGHQAGVSSAAGASSTSAVTGAGVSSATGVSAGSFASPAGAEPSSTSVAPSGCLSVRPSTWLIDRPRSVANSSGVRNPRRPA